MGDPDAASLSRAASWNLLTFRELGGFGILISIYRLVGVNRAPDRFLAEHSSLQCDRFAEKSFAGFPGEWLRYLKKLTLRPQRKSEQTVSRSDRYVLLSACRIRHRTRSDGTTHRCLPQQRAVTGVQGKEISVASAAKQQIRNRRENSGVSNVGHLELPLPLAGFRVDGTDSAVTFFVGAEILNGRPIIRNRRSDYSAHVSPTLL